MTAPQPVRVLFLTKYARKGASSRYRTFQYLPWLEREGLYSQVMPMFDEAYLDHRYRFGHGTLVDIFRAFLRRVSSLFEARHYDVVVVEKEILPYFFALPERWLSWMGIPYVADYDDALFHQYDLHKNWWVRLLLGRKIARVMRGAHTVTVGNAYLADYAASAGAQHVELIPTVLDLDRYSIAPLVRPAKTTFTIGWIGSPSTATYLLELAPVLANICADGRARVLLIGSGPIELVGVPSEVLEWDEISEVSLLRQFDVGIMPLVDGPWERGKCGFKLIQYMACGLPVVASPVGINCQIVEDDLNGFLASSPEEWELALLTLLNDASLCQRMGQAGRRMVEEHYSIQVTGPGMVELLKSVGGED